MDERKGRPEDFVREWAADERGAAFLESVWKNSTLAAGDGVDQVRRLKASSGGALVIFGGVQTVRSTVAADLVDECWLKFKPVVDGRGSSMFSDLTERRSLTLRGVKSFPSGLIDATYTTT
jgi:dihydrofolate reductase